MLVRLTFIAQRPVFDGMRLLPAGVLSSQICPSALARAVTVFHPSQCLFQCAGAHIQTDVWFETGQAAICYILVCTEAV